MPAKLNMKSNRHWVSLVPYGLNQQHPNAYKDILSTIWENRDNLGYAYRILRDGCCDGCALGTTGMRDWTMERSEEHTSELQSLAYLVCRLLLEKKKKCKTMLTRQNML